MQQRLSLSPTTAQMARFAVFLQLRDVPANCTPSRDLPQIICVAAPAVISAIPLKPAARVVFVNPATLSPHRQRLRRIDAEAIQCSVVLVWTQFGTVEPPGRKFCHAVGHVLTAKHAESEHLLGREVGPEVGMEVLARSRSEPIRVTALHQIIDLDPSRVHRSDPGRPIPCCHHRHSPWRIPRRARARFNALTETD